MFAWPQGKGTLMQQHHRTRLAAGARRAVTRMKGRRTVTRVFLALAVVALLPSAVSAQPPPYFPVTCNGNLALGHF